jgi:hypothetical protein
MREVLPQVQTVRVFGCSATAASPKAQIAISRSIKPGMRREDPGPMFAELDIECLRLTHDVLINQVAKSIHRRTNHVIVTYEKLAAACLRH